MASNELSRLMLAMPIVVGLARALTIHSGKSATGEGIEVQHRGVRRNQKTSVRWMADKHLNSETQLRLLERSLPQTIFAKR